MLAIQRGEGRVADTERGSTYVGCRERKDVVLTMVLIEDMVLAMVLIENALMLLLMIEQLECKPTTAITKQQSHTVLGVAAVEHGPAITITKWAMALLGASARDKIMRDAGDNTINNN